MNRARRRLTAVLLTLVAASSTGCQKSPGFSYTVDASLTPKPATLGGHPLAQVSDPDGLKTLFVANALLVRPGSQSKLDAVLKELNDHGLEATLVSDDAVPTPPATSKASRDPAYAAPTTYLIELNPAKAHAYLDSFAADAVTAGFEGDILVSGIDAAALLAVVMHVAASGIEAGPDFVSTPDAFTSTEEAPDGAGGHLDAFTMTPFLTTGSKSDVVEAWQLVAAADPGLLTRVKLVVIDGGFWLDDTGHPNTASTGAWSSDLPSLPVQHDFNGKDDFAGGMNPTSCTGGFPCPWHGNGSVGVAAGALDNLYGGAGTGGQVADPWLFKVSMRDSQVRHALRTAISWNADVVSMSFGGDCGKLCRFGRHFNGYYDAFEDARGHGLVLVASAGNDNVDVDSKHTFPCTLTGVICVGALADGSSDRISYSNHGTQVDIWAPTDILAMPNGTSAPELVDHNGTSASAPFVAGIAAMLRAFDHTLTSDDVKTLLRDHAWRDSTDADVDRYVNAYASLRMVAPDVDIEPVISVAREGSTSLVVDLNRPFQVLATTSDVEDGTPCCEVVWTPAPDTVTARGRGAAITLTTEGPHTITATATDSGGAHSQATLEVSVRNRSPVARIDQPVAGAHVLSGADVQLLGVGTDANEGPGPGPGMLPCSALRWVSTDASDVGLPATGCDLTVQFSTPGARTVELDVTDPQGAWSVAYLHLVVDAPPTNYPPTLHVGALPAFTYNGDGYPVTTPLSFAASATDPEGNTPVSYTWRATSYSAGLDTVVYARDVVVGAATTSSGNLGWTPGDTPSLFISGCTGANAYSGQKVELSVQATDALGNASTATLPPFRVYRCTLN